MTLASVVGGTVFGMILFAGIQTLLPSFEMQLGRTQGGRQLLSFLGHKTSVTVSPVGREADWTPVLPENIVDLQIPMVHNPHYGLHLVALGQNGSLYHRFQTGPTNTSALMPYTPMSQWHVLTPDPTLFWGNSPAIALNADGRMELVVGNANGSLDLFQMYQTDAKDPLAWSKPRPPWCDALGPPADPACKYCADAPASDKCHEAFWTTTYFWATSQQSLWLDPSDNKLKLTWRSFTNQIFTATQREASNSMQWDNALVTLEGVYE